MIRSENRLRRKSVEPSRPTPAEEVRIQALAPTPACAKVRSERLASGASSWVASATVVAVSRG
jgi:hypothetical protein